MLRYKLNTNNMFVICKSQSIEINDNEWFSEVISGNNILQIA